MTKIFKVSVRDHKYPSASASYLVRASSMAQAEAKIIKMLLSDKDNWAKPYAVQIEFLGEAN